MQEMKPITLNKNCINKLIISISQTTKRLYYFFYKTLFLDLLFDFL